MPVTKDDIGAIASRIDAQTITIIRALAEMHNKDPDDYEFRYSDEYDKLAKKLRKDIIGE